VVLALTLLLSYHRHPWRQLNSCHPFGLAKTVVAFSLVFLLLSSLATRHPAFPPPNIDNLLVVSKKTTTLGIAQSKTSS
jgi:hypothetical protein